MGITHLLRAGERRKEEEGERALCWSWELPLLPPADMMLTLRVMDSDQDVHTGPGFSGLQVEFRCQPLGLLLADGRSWDSSASLRPSASSTEREWSPLCTVGPGGAGQVSRFHSPPRRAVTQLPGTTRISF